MPQNSRNASNKKRSSRRRSKPKARVNDKRIWHELMTSLVTSPVTGNHRAVFTNRTLRLDRIEAIGFDLDHTLAIYNCAALDSLAMRLVIDRLINEEGYPTEFFDDLPEPSFARKGLIVDIELGNILKIDRFGHVLTAYRGNTKLTRDQKREEYGNFDVIPHVTNGKRFMQSDTAFANPEILIYAAVISHIPREKSAELYHQIREHTDMIHRDGSLKESITANPLDYLHPDFDTLTMLQRLRDGGKKVFLLTNSEWEYTNAIIGAAIGVDPNGDPSAWLDLFDLVIVESRKPRYFKTETPRAEEIEVDGRIALRGGNILDIEERLGVTGPDVLYVGDHIYSDLIKSKREQHWRTMLVIPELEEELKVHAVLPGLSQQLHASDARRSMAERNVQHWTALEKALSNVGQHDPLLEQFRNDCSRNRKQAVHALRQHISQREALRKRISNATNKYWGSLFRAGNELTYYGKQTEDFACTYTGRATNLALYSPDHYFRSAMDYMPHEIEII